MQVAIQILDYSLLVWLGSMYAPLLPFFGVAANIAQFYVKMLLALYLYTPPKERYSASRTNVIVYCLMLGAHVPAMYEAACPARPFLSRLASAIICACGNCI